MSEPFNYYQRFSSAMVRGEVGEQYPGHVLFSKYLEDLTEEEHVQLFEIGEKHNLKLTFFQRVEPLPETVKVLDILRGISPDNVLDIGCGRGAFIWRLLDEYRNLSITAIDKEPQRIEKLESVIKGGIVNLSAKVMDARKMEDFPREAFDVTTALKVLEYVDEVEEAVAELCRVTKRFVIVQFPAHKDNNPEKKHFFTPEKMIELFKANDVMQIRMEKMSNYHILVARK